MTDLNSVLWKELRKFYSEANRQKNHSKVDSEVAIIWKSFKKDPGFPGNVRQKIQELKKKAADTRGKLDAYWVWSTKVFKNTILSCVA